MKGTAHMPMLRHDPSAAVYQETAQIRHFDPLAFELECMGQVPLVEEGHRFPLPLADGRSGELHIYACPSVADHRLTFYVDRFECDAAKHLQPRWPVEEAACAVVMACPWMSLHTPRMIVHMEYPLKDTKEVSHVFYDLHCTISHGRLIGHGSSPLGNPSQGYRGLYDLMGPHCALIEHYLPTSVHQKC